VKKKKLDLYFKINLGCLRPPHHSVWIARPTSAAPKRDLRAVGRSIWGPRHSESVLIGIEPVGNLACRVSNVDLIGGTE
jgi:hypothetical protein